MKRKNQEMKLVGGPRDGLIVSNYVAYLDKEAKPVSTSRGDRIRRSGVGGLYYNRGTYYEWNNK